MAIVVVAASLAGGCRQVALDGRSLLSEPRMSGDSVVLDLFFVQLPFADERLGEPLWGELDEQKIPASTRQQLTRYGFRAGISGAHAPIALEQLLASGQLPATASETVIDNFAIDPVVRRRHMQLPAGRPGEVATSRIYPTLPLLEINESGQVVGETFKKAETRFSLTAQPQPDGRVRLTLRPEIHHGEFKPQIEERDQILRIDPHRNRRAFDSLAIETTLANGEMLVITSLPSRTGSAGHYFFTESAGGSLRQKLLVVRLSQTQRDGLLEIPDFVEYADDAAAPATAEPSAASKPPLDEIPAADEASGASG